MNGNESNRASNADGLFDVPRSKWWMARFYLGFCVGKVLKWSKAALRAGTKKERKR
jgi:hypothetical protein